MDLRAVTRGAARSISVVLPAFNEAENIVACVGAARSALGPLGLSWEILVVDDGSTDGTWQLLEQLGLADGRIRGLRHPRNQGYGTALRTGFAAARHELIFFTDADLQFDLSELSDVLALAPRFDVVLGYRHSRRDPWVRRLNAWAWGALVGRLFDTSIRDVDCAFKLFHRNVIDQLELRSAGAMLNTELLVRARAAGFSLCEVPVSHHPRRAGRQTGAHPAVIARAFAELIQLHGELSRDTCGGRQHQSAQRDPAVATGASGWGASGAPVMSSGRPASLANTTR